MPRSIWADLQQSISGELLRPDDPDFEAARLSQIGRFDTIVPSGVVRCADTGDVAETIRFSRRCCVPMAVRAGGHSYAGFSSTTGVLLDVGPMNGVTLDGDAVDVAPGATIGNLVDALHATGRMVPLGACLSVGVAGSTLGGGVGIAGRRYGLSLDQLLEADVVLADGTVVTCDVDRHPELFWALRGAGAGNFGVVTRLRLRTRPAQRVSSASYRFSAPAASRVADSWLAHLQRSRLPDELCSALLLNDSGDLAQDVSVSLDGALIGGSAHDVEALFDSIIESAGVEPAARTIRDDDWFTACQLWGEAGRPREGCRFTKSELFDHVLPHDVLDELVSAYTRHRRAGHNRGLEMFHLGGQYNRVDRRATAFWHRDQLFSVKHKSTVAVTSPLEDQRAAHEFAVAAHAICHPHGSGYVYPNYPDPELIDWIHAYYGDNAQTLTHVKRRYDPDNLFRFSQSIPLS